jgi:hypothetical protein
MCNSMWLVQTVVGHEGVAGWSDGISQQARLNKPTSISCLADVSFIIADAGNNCLRLVHPNVRRGSKMRPQEQHLSRWKDGSGFDTRALGLVDFMVRVCCIRAAAQPRSRAGGVNSLALCVPRVCLLTRLPLPLPLPLPLQDRKHWTNWAWVETVRVTDNDPEERLSERRGRAADGRTITAHMPLRTPKVRHTTFHKNSTHRGTAAAQYTAPPHHHHSSTLLYYASAYT